MMELVKVFQKENHEDPEEDFEGHYVIRNAEHDYGRRAVMYFRGPAGRAKVIVRYIRSNYGTEDWQYTIVIQPWGEFPLTHSINDSVRDRTSISYRAARWVGFFLGEKMFG